MPVLTMPGDIEKYSKIRTSGRVTRVVRMSCSSVSVFASVANQERDVLTSDAAKTKDKKAALAFNRESLQMVASV
jgi:hypothetical protein